MGRRNSHGWPRYVPAAERRAKAQKKVNQLIKKGLAVEPVEIEGRKISRTFWGCGWCDHLESFSDYSNRLPRGRSYVRNGSVCHLAISEGAISAMVIGSHLYNVEISIGRLPEQKWAQLKERCAGQIGSLVELLQGEISDGIMATVTDRDNGLFPLPGEIEFDCDCPDWADMCKHVAAVLYGAGRRLDERPEMLFILRGVDVDELISAGAEKMTRVGSGNEDGAGADHPGSKRGGRRRRAGADDLDDLEDLFGIDLDGESAGAAGTEPTAGAGPIDQPETGGQTGGAQQPVSSKKRGRVQRPGNEQPPGDAELSGGVRLSEAAQLICAGTITPDRIKALRAEYGLSQKRFGNLLGVSSATVSNWENSKKPLNLHGRTLTALKKVAKN